MSTPTNTALIDGTYAYVRKSTGLCWHLSYVYEGRAINTALCGALGRRWSSQGWAITSPWLPEDNQLPVCTSCYGIALRREARRA